MKPPDQKGAEPGRHRAEKELTQRTNHRPGTKSNPRHALNTVIGTRELCAWQPVPGVTWVQCRVAEHANRLAKRSDSRLVVRGMAGGYLKTYEFHHSLAWAERLIRRYTRNNHTANERLSTPATPAGAFSSAVT